MKALILAGGLPQQVLIKQLKERGVTTVLADGSVAPLALPYADAFYHVDIFDVEAVKDIAVNEKVDFLITVCADQVLLVVAQVSEMLGLPWYIDYETAKMVSDKALMKNAFVKSGIPTSQYVVMNKLDIDLLNHLHFPLIVKPVDTYSSMGVRKVQNMEELKQAFAGALHLSRTKKVIVEEFFDGEEISVDLFVVNGKAHTLCVSNSEKVKDKDKFVIFRGRYPATLSSALLAEIEIISQKIADAFDLTNAPMLVQMLTDGSKVTVLEFCARTGGAMKWLLIQRSCGVDVIQNVIDLTMGSIPNVTLRQPESKFIVNDFIYCRKGIFDRLDGFDEQNKLGNISDFRCLRPRGKRLSGSVASSSDRIAGVTIQADSIVEFNQKHRDFVSSVKILDVNGNDIMRHDLLPGLE